MNSDESPHFELEFDSKGKFRRSWPVNFNFNPYDDKPMTVSILKKQLADVEQLSSKRPQTDEVLRRLAKIKSAFETLIESFSDTGTSPEVRTYPKKEKRIMKAMRRKAARFEQGRK